MTGKTKWPWTRFLFPDQPRVVGWDGRYHGCCRCDICLSGIRFEFPPSGPVFLPGGEERFLESVKPFGFIATRGNADVVWGTPRDGVSRRYP